MSFFSLSVHCLMKDVGWAIGMCMERRWKYAWGYTYRHRWMHDHTHKCYPLDLISRRTTFFGRHLRLFGNPASSKRMKIRERGKRNVFFASMVSLCYCCRREDRQWLRIKSCMICWCFYDKIFFVCLFFFFSYFIVVVVAVVAVDVSAVE